jgi:cytidylate kinase
MESYRNRITDIVDREVKRWEMERTQKRKAQQLQEPWPIITISREYGALGAKLAQALAEKTGWTCWDQEIVHALAEHSEAPESMFRSLDEHQQDQVTSIINSFFGERLNEREYLHQLMRVVHSIASRGQAIIVGRGAHYILDPADMLRVRLVSARDQRIEGLMKRKNIEWGVADTTLTQIDEERREFMTNHYDANIQDPHGFDLVINVDHIPIDAVVDIVLSAYRARFERSPLDN